MECLDLNVGQLCARQVSYPLCFLAGNTPVLVENSCFHVRPTEKITNTKCLEKIQALFLYSAKFGVKLVSLF